jgi:hypothetical protein
MSPAWNPSSQTPELSAEPSSVTYYWDPSSRTPGPPTWLEDPSFAGIRFKLVEKGLENKILEFQSIERTTVRVRDLASYRNVPLESISWLRPEGVKDTVTPIVGELKGQVFQVKSVDEQQWTIYTVGRRLNKKKGEKDPVLNRSDLAQVFPKYK